MTARFPLVSFISVALARSVFRFQLPPVKPCMRFSRTRLTDAVHRRHSVSPARPVGPGCDNGSVQADQPADGPPTRRPAPDQPKPRPRWCRLPMNTASRITACCSDLVEAGRGVPVAEIARPAAQEPVDLLHDLLDRQQQPGPNRQFPDPVAGMLHRLSAGQRARNATPLPPGVRPRAHQPVVKAEESRHPSPPTANCTMRVLAAFGSKPSSASSSRSRAKRGLGLLPGSAHHHSVVGVPHQHPDARGVPIPVEPVQVDVAHQRD